MNREVFESLPLALRELAELAEKLEKNGVELHEGKG